MNRFEERVQRIMDSKQFTREVAERVVQHVIDNREGPTVTCPFCSTRYESGQLHMCPDTQESEIL